MRSLTMSNAHPQISGLIYSRVAELLFIGLLLVFIYPFFFVISGTDPTIPIESQSETKNVYYLQMALPFFCLVIALMCRGSGVCLPSAIMIYAGICLASTVWSVDPYDTFKQASLVFLYILAIAAVCQVLDIGTFCKIIVKLLVFLMLASVVMAVAFPKYGIHQVNDSIHQDENVGRWRGVFAHKNQLGAAASISVFTFLFLRRLINVSVGFRVICIVAAIVCLICAQSANSWIALCMLLVYYWLIGAVRASRSTLMLIVVGVSALAFTAFSFFSEDLVAVVGRDATFSGRTDIWRIVLDAIWQKPLLGYGYYAATADFMRPLLVGEIGKAAVDAHNGYLDVLLGTGIVGLVLLLCCISSVIVIGIGRVKTSAPERDFFMLLLSFPILGLLSSFFEVAALSGVQDPLGALTILSLTAIPLYLRFDRGTYQWTSAGHTGSAARLSVTGSGGTAR
ncbi:exopolysaccharide production protein ExoQ [Bradyrhizobium sp. AZCC 1610]